VGGFSKALRTIPQIRKIADALLRRGAKDPWLVNFTNPVGIVTEALVRFHEIRAVGICNGSLTMHKGVSDLLGARMEDTEIDYVGPNHFAWVLDVRRKGRSVLPAVIKKMIEKEGLPTALNITKVKMTPEIMARAEDNPHRLPQVFLPRRRGGERGQNHPVARGQGGRNRAAHLRGLPLCR
jgi:6-phospho-beta-glucosidase